jgi:hypothetical protein
MSEPFEASTRMLALEGTTSDPCDGLIRLLADCQRFDLTVRAIDFRASRTREGRFALTIDLTDDYDATQLHSRFARHVAITSLRSRALQACSE